MKHMILGMVLLTFSQTSLALDEEPNWIEGFLLFTFNSGAMLEFGDELFCTATSAISRAESEALLESASFKECRNISRYKILYTEQHHPWIALCAAILGYVLFAPVSWLYFLFTKKPGTAKELFAKTFKFELIEGGICVVGQLLTDGVFQSAAFSMILALAAGLIRGSCLAFLFTWRKDKMFRFKTVSVAILLSVGTCYLIANSTAVHAGGSGGALKKIFNEAASTPQPNYGRLNYDYSPPGMGTNSAPINNAVDNSYKTPINHTWHMPGVTPNSGVKSQFNGYSNGYK